MPGRKYSIANSNYRYGFNGKENDNDIENGAQDYGMRIYDRRLGRFKSVDPITKNYPELTPYQFASNTPIQAIDIDGLEAFFVHGTWSDSRTWSALKNENYASINNATGNKTDFTFDWQYNNIKGANLDAARQKAGRQLADRIMQIHKLHPDEPITIVGHSHGGNVGIIATNILAKKGYQVNYLITINTPAREYQLSHQAQKGTQHFNIYDPYDPIQSHGGNAITILPLLNGIKGTGEFGLAGRTFDNAKNLDVYRKDAWYNPRGFTQFFDFGNDVHNSHNKPQLWSGWLYNRIQGDKWYSSYQQQQSQSYEKRSQDPSYNSTDNTMVSNPPPTLPTRKKE